MPLEKDDHGESDDDKVTVTRGELRAMLERKEREATMTDDEKRTRALVREEVKGAFDELFALEDDDEDKPDRKQSPKGAGKASGSKSLFDQFVGGK